MPARPPPISDWCARLQQKPASSRIITHEDRPGDHPVRQVVPARDVRVGQDEDVLRARSYPAKSRRQRPDGEAAPAGMDRECHRHWRPAFRAGSVMKQEKSWLWLKIGLRAVRVMTQPMCREIWSSRFCINARTTGSRPSSAAAWGASGAPGFGDVDHEVAGAIDAKMITRSDQHGRCVLFDDRRAGAGAAPGVPGSRTVMDGRIQPAMAIVPDRTLSASVVADPSARAGLARPRQSCAAFPSGPAPRSRSPAQTIRPPG